MSKADLVPSQEEQAAFLAANKDAMHIVWWNGHSPFPMVAMHMFDPETGVEIWPFRFEYIQPRYGNFIQHLTTLSIAHHKGLAG